MAHSPEREAIKALYSANQNVQHHQNELRLAKEDEQNIIRAHLKDLMDCGAVTVRVSQARLNHLEHNS